MGDNENTNPDAPVTENHGTHQDPAKPYSPTQEVKTDGQTPDAEAVQPVEPAPVVTEQPVPENGNNNEDASDNS